MDNIVNYRLRYFKLAILLVSFGILIFLMYTFELYKLTNLHTFIIRYHPVIIQKSDVSYMPKVKDATWSSSRFTAVSRNEITNTTTHMSVYNTGYSTVRSKPEQGQIYSKKSVTCIKQIQYWAPFSYTLADGKYNCTEEDCTAIFIHGNSYDIVENSHAIILHHKGSWNTVKLSSHRPDGQIWIYSSMESPIHSRKAHLPEGYGYNWTMTYRTDSDIVNPYGRYIGNIPEVTDNDNRNWADNKTGKIIWIASNCADSSWDRPQFVKLLQQYVKVDTYGRCGNQICHRNDKCDSIMNSHKFYLAIENSECQDYITEKFWQNSFSHHLIPIVYGTIRADYEKVAPPYSFIHLSDFSNIEALADYIKYLDKNDRAYNQYFEWRKRGSVKINKEDGAITKESLCNIVKKLKEVDEMRRSEHAKELGMVDMSKWWSASCKHLTSVWSTQS